MGTSDVKVFVSNCSPTTLTYCGNQENNENQLNIWISQYGEIFQN